MSKKRMDLGEVTPQQTGSGRAIAQQPSALEGDGREVGVFKREGTCVYLWVIHADARRKPTQYYKAVILQLK